MLLQTEHAPDVRERLLTAARTGLVESLQARPTELPAVRRLVKVSRALSDDALQQAALGDARLARRGRRQAEGAFAQLAARKARSPQIAIGEAMLRSILAPGDDGPIADLFALLGPTLAEAFGPNLQACGVAVATRSTRAAASLSATRSRPGPARSACKEFDLYVGGKDPLAVQGIPGETPALVVGAGVNAPLSAMTRGRVARELLAMARGTTVARTRDDITVAAIVVAACGQAELKVDHPPYAVLAEVERLLGKAMARKTASCCRTSAAPWCRATPTRAPGARGRSPRRIASRSIASGDPAVVLGEVLGTSPEKLGAAVKGNAARRRAAALRGIPEVPRDPARAGAGGRRMTDDKKSGGAGPDEHEWDEALSEWDNKTFVPEIAKDTSTDKPAPPVAVSKPLYRPPVPPRRSRSPRCPRRRRRRRPPPLLRHRPRRPRRLLSPSWTHPKTSSRRKRGPRSSPLSRASCCAGKTPARSRPRAAGWGRCSPAKRSATRASRSPSMNRSPSRSRRAASSLRATCSPARRPSCPRAPTRPRRCRCGVRR